MSWNVTETWVDCYVCCKPKDTVGFDVMTPQRHHVQGLGWKTHHLPIGLTTKMWPIPWIEWLGDER